MVGLSQAMALLAAAESYHTMMVQDLQMMTAQTVAG